ncbi:hypothetical protein JFQ88_004055 [Aeromonas dhakensis]|nr:hypothetical protein [Aeromonas dhakensis]
MQDEIDYLMAMDESGVIVHEGESAILNNVAEWMDTPRGHVYGNPAWGNRFAAFKHSPPSEAVEIGIENMVVTDLPRDVVGVVVRGVRCAPSPTQIDMYHVQIDTNLGFVSHTLSPGGNQ